MKEAPPPKVSFLSKLLLLHTQQQGQRSAYLFKVKQTQQRTKITNKSNKRPVTVDPIHTMALVLTRSGDALVAINFTASSLEPCKTDETVMDQ